MTRRAVWAAATAQLCEPFVDPTKLNMLQRIDVNYVTQVRPPLLPLLVESRIVSAESDCQPLK